ncbi:NADH-quinone oxidoreductase subunit NuoE [Nitrosomonas sp. Nm166]|uniref:NADH-quinone oxidoreductase subunit NuoE n=1 Tax=Nitrosomonas sp. Nm166 TaxID=1881054 RepID=UPI0008EFE60D|nr:NADH-quinone oxidoreductase subunit NuoE [Nitrosomonas sp. Nm166]SFF07485.1 NADH-quinone oxidoreductase subunit E [Nitrosomonas sp. Nm166]
MLSTESLKKIDREIAKYPTGKKQSAVMSALAIAQEEKGWLANETINFVAEYLDMPSIAVYEVATFYNMYNLEPVGEHKITICTNLPCALSGSKETAAYLKKKLGIEFNQTTPDGKFTLKEGECFGACGDAPVLLVNNKRMCSFMSNEMIDKLLEELSK